MWHEHLRPFVRGNEPVAGQGNAIHLSYIVGLRLLPFLKVDGARKRRQHDELRESETGPLGKIMCGVKRVGAIALQAEDERTEDMHAVIGKRPELFYQIVARQVEILVICPTRVQGKGIAMFSGWLEQVRKDYNIRLVFANGEEEFAHRAGWLCLWRDIDGEFDGIECLSEEETQV